MEYVSPVLDGHIPFLLDVHDSQVDRLFSSLVVGELDFCFGILSYAPVQIFNGIGGIDDFSDFQGEVKITGQVVPVGSPGLDGIFVFAFPFGSKFIQRLLGHLPVGCCIHFLQVAAKSFPIFPNHILATVADLVYNAQLGNGLGENAFNSIGKAFQVVVQAIRISSTPRAFRSVSTLIQKAADSVSAIHIPSTSLRPSLRNPMTI